MKRFVVVSLVAVALLAVPADVQVYFSPLGGCQQAVVESINKAASEIDVAIYIFTNPDIAEALVAAKVRGVKVRVLLDGDNVDMNYSKAESLVDNGIPVRHETGTGLMHNKFAVVDDSIVLTGSFNWTRAAESANDENLLKITSPDLAAQYAEEFSELWTLAAVFAPAPSPLPQTETVYITRTGSKYHRAGCSYLSRSCIPISLSEAKRRGYTPCSVCRP